VVSMCVTTACSTVRLGYCREVRSRSHTAGQVGGSTRTHCRAGG
jgi:hypothetical protein